MRRLVLPALLMLVAGQARAQTGNDLLELCSATNEHAWKQVACFQYVMGVFDVHLVWSSVGWIRRQWCIPEKRVPGEQIVRVAQKFIEQHPELSHLEGGGLVALALTEAFPCE